MAPIRRPKVSIRKDWQRSAKGCWSLSLGERGCRVRIFQREPNGSFCRETWIEGRGRTAAALQTRDRLEAKRLGEAFFLALLGGDRPSIAGPLTLEGLWTRYQEECPAYRQLTKGSRGQRKHDADLLLAAFGGKKPVEHLTLQDVAHYVEVRRRGTGWQDGRKTPPVKNRTIAGELQVLRTMLLWAITVREPDGSWLLRDNPLRGLKLPREENPKRPVATFERFKRLRAAIQQLAVEASREDRRTQWVRLELALVLAEATGARIGAIRGLRWSDISYSPPRIHWRAEFDKRGRDRVVPMPPELVQDVRNLQSQLGVIGDGWLFPVRDGQQPRSREQFAQRLLAAERRAGLEHLKGGVWHPFRRKWATERKHHPLVDVMATGGWKDSATLLACYQHTDDQSMLAVMEEPKKLRSLGAV